MRRQIVNVSIDAGARRVPRGVVVSVHADPAAAVPISDPTGRSGPRDVTAPRPPKESGPRRAPRRAPLDITAGGPSVMGPSAKEAAEEALRSIPQAFAQAAPTEPVRKRGNHHNRRSANADSNDEG